MNLKSLEDATQNQLAILQEVLNLEETKHQQLLSGKLKDFAKINQSLLETLERLELAELERNNVLEDMLRSENHNFMGKKEIHFSDIIKALEGHEKHAEMLAIHENMKNTVDKIKYYTGINKDLIEMALNVLNITLGQQGKEIDYTKRSEVKENHSLLVNKVI